MFVGRALVPSQNDNKKYLKVSISVLNTLVLHANVRLAWNYPRLLSYMLMLDQTGSKDRPMSYIREY